MMPRIEYVIPLPTFAARLLSTVRRNHGCNPRSRTQGFVIDIDADCATLYHLTTNFFKTIFYPINDCSVLHDYSFAAFDRHR